MTTTYSLDELRARGVRLLGFGLIGAMLMTVGAAALISPGDVAVVAGLAAMVGALPLLLWWQGRRDAITRTSFGIAMPMLPAIMLFVMRGHAWQMDMHMIFFAALATLMLLCDWRPILAATLVTAVHHLVLNVAVPLFVFDSSGSFGRVILHAVILLVEAGVLITLSLRLTSLINALAEEHDQAVAADGARHAAESARMAEQQAIFSAQQRVTGLLQSAFTAMADGDLRQRLNALPSEYRQIEHDFNAGMGGLADMIGRVVATSTDVAHETGVISEATTELVSHAEHQAAAIDGATGALALISTEVSTIADRARATAEQMNEMVGNAARGGELATAMRSAMGEVVDSTAEIAAIVHVIDQIAFQTNLLALNAGVEAARAGDAGHGFAVVANEVRALSERTAVAARDVSKLIGATKNRLDVGMEHVTGSATVLDALVEDIGEVSALMQEIVGATDNQSSSLASISHSVDQLSRGTQRSAGMTQECDAAVRRLGALTTQLGRDVARYKVAGGGSPARAPSRRAA